MGCPGKALWRSLGVTRRVDQAEVINVYRHAGASSRRRVVRWGAQAKRYGGHSGSLGELTRPRSSTSTAMRVHPRAEGSPTLWLALLLSAIGVAVATGAGPTFVWWVCLFSPPRPLVVLSGFPGFERVAINAMQGRIPLQVDVVFPEVAVSGPFVTMPSIDPLPCYLLLMLAIFVHMSTSGA